MAVLTSFKPWQWLAIWLLLSISVMASAERIKDLTSIAGIRDNPLLGYGLVVGLDGTGDGASQAPFTEQSLRTMLSQFGVALPPGVTLKPRNVAAVTVHTVLPPFAKPGQSIDVTVSSLGNAASLRGGTLLMTPLRAANGEVYALAQGNLIVAGVSAEGADGSSTTINVPSVARIPNGAIVEQAVISDFHAADQMMLNLHTADFSTATRVAAAINHHFPHAQAEAMDAVTIAIQSPQDAGARVAFLSALQALQVAPGDAVARIIVNSRTGTVVIGKHVTVMPAAVSHGNLTVTIDETVDVSQPNPLANGETIISNDSSVDIGAEHNQLRTIDRGVTLQQVVESINAVGASTNDLIAILQALQQVGALTARIEVI